MNLLFVSALFLFWLILSGSLHPLHLLTGILVAFFVVWLSPKGLQRQRTFSLFSALVFGPWLFLRVMKSGIHVCRLILHPKLPISPRLKTQTTQLTEDGELTVLGNAITLTPGTITIEVEPGKLVVHALDSASLQDLDSGALERRVAAMFPSQLKDKSGSTEQ